jgi:imidazolonepropionase-like amidohydrolase
MVLDGRGEVRRNTRIVIEADKIMALDPAAAPVDYDLSGLTVLPGWIDAHVHLTWIFGKDGNRAERRLCA